MLQSNYNSTLRITIRERERWFKYYNILKYNHLINFIIIKGLRKKATKEWGVNTTDLVILVLIYLYRNKQGLLKKKTILDAFDRFSEYDSLSITRYMQSLIKRGFLHKSTAGDYSLTMEGRTIVISFQRYFFRTYRNLSELLPDTN